MKASRRSTPDSPPRSAPARTQRPRVFDPREPWLVPSILLIACRFASTVGIRYSAEDAYITFRYARNLAAGSGLVYNPNERVFGFSSPLWTVWSALGFKLGAPPVEWTRLTALAADLLTLALLTALLRRHVSRASAWCFAVFFAAWPYFGAVSGSGMEMPLMLALIALGGWAVERKTPWAGAVIGALGLVRPEGLASAAVLAIWASWRARLVAGAIVALGLTALGLYFGSPIPQSVVAKSLLYGTPGPWAARHWWDWLSPVLFGDFPGQGDTSQLFLLVVLFAPAAVAGALQLRSRLTTGLAAATAACLVVWAGYAVVGVAYFWWYLLVPLAGLSLLASVGLPGLVQGRALYISAALLVVGLWTITPKLYIGRAQNEYYGFARASEILRANSRAGQKVVLEPIGMIGYAAPLVVVDEVGLVSPQVARRRLQGPGWYSDVIASERPDWLVVRRGVLESGMAFAGAGSPFRNVEEREAIKAQFETIGVADSSAGPMALLIMRRR